MSWEPLPREELDSLLAKAVAELDDDVRATWERIRIAPEKWHCSPWGDQGGGFWAVAVEGRNVVWFNDIEEGFNLSPYTERGIIAEYGCNQDTLVWVLERITSAHRAPRRLSWNTDAVPTELRMPGAVVLQ